MSKFRDSNSAAGLLVRDVWLGLIRPSGVALAVCIATVLSCFGVASAVLTPQFMVDYGDRAFSWGGADWDMFSTSEALELQRHPTDRPAVVIAGGSTTRSAFLESSISQSLASAVNPTPVVYNLCTGGQSLWDTAAFLNCAPDGSEGIAVIGVTPGQFLRGGEEIAANFGHRLGFRSTVYDGLLADHGRPQRPVTGVYWIDNAPFFLARWQLPFKRAVRPITPLDSRTLGLPALETEEWLAHSTMVAERFDDAPAGAGGEALGRLEATIRDVQARTRLSICIVEAPVSNRFLREFELQEHFRQIRADVRSLAEREGVPYVDINEVIHLPDDAFYDWAHLNDEGAVAACSDFLVKLLVRELKRG